MILVLVLLSQISNLDALYNSATTLLVQFHESKDSAFQQLVNLGKDSTQSDATIDFLVSHFDTKISVERNTLKDILKAIGAPAIKGIVKRLDYRGSDKEARSLKQSIVILGEIGGEEIVEPASRFIHDEDWQVRSAAYTALGKSQSKKAKPFIQEGLNDSIAHVRKSAYYALATLVSHDDSDVLRRGLSDTFYGVRYAAVQGLRTIEEYARSALQADIGKDERTDFFIVSVLASCDSCEHLVPFMKTLSPPARLVVYEACDDTTRLKEFLEQEPDSLLHHYIREKIAQ